MLIKINEFNLVRYIVIGILLFTFTAELNNRNSNKVKYICIYNKFTIPQFKFNLNRLNNNHQISYI